MVETTVARKRRRRRRRSVATQGGVVEGGSSVGWRGVADLAVQLVVEVLVDLLGVAVLAQKAAKDAQAPHPDDLGGQASLPGTPALTCCGSPAAAQRGECGGEGVESGGGAGTQGDSRGCGHLLSQGMPHWGPKSLSCAISPPPPPLPSPSIFLQKCCPPRREPPGVERGKRRAARGVEGRRHGGGSRGRGRVMREGGVMGLLGLSKGGEGKN